jgi:phosphatidylglycerophosphatase A
MRRAFDEIFGTVLGLGHIPVIPATWTSLAVAALIYALHQWLSAGLGVQIALLVLFVVTGVPACGGLERRYGEDPKQATADEAAGQTIALLGAPLDPLTVLVGFFFFRVFDVLKPWPARQLESLHGGMGIMADDLAAGVYARIVVQLWVVFAAGNLT